MNKESISEKFLKRFYGINGVLDEYKRQEINRIGNNAFIVVFWYFLFANFIALLVFENRPELAFGGLVATNILLLLGVTAYIIRGIAKLHLSENEVEAKDFKQTRRRIIYQGIFLAVYFGVAIYFLSLLIDFVTHVPVHLLSGSNFRSSLLAGVLFGSLMSVVNWRRVKKIEEN